MATARPVCLCPDLVEEDLLIPASLLQRARETPQESLRARCEVVADREQNLPREMASFPVTDSPRPCLYCAFEEICTVRTGTATPTMVVERS